MNAKSSLPAINRLSVIVAPIILVYTIIPFINITPVIFSIGIFNLSFPFIFNLTYLLYLMSAVLAGLGMNWLLIGHAYPLQKHRYQHWFVPALTTWIFGVFMSSVTMGSQYWILLFLGAAFLILVYTAEYLVVDPDDYLQPIAAISLTALSLGLFLVLAVSIRTTTTRLYLGLPVIFFSSMIVIIRSYFLRNRGTWNLISGLIPAIVVTQIAVGLHYLPINSFSYGAVLTGALFAFTHNLDQWKDQMGSNGNPSWLVPIISLLIFLLIAYFFQT